MRQYTINVSGSERHDGEKSYTVVVEADTMAQAKCTAGHPPRCLGHRETNHGLFAAIVVRQLPADVAMNTANRDLRRTELDAQLDSLRAMRFHPPGVAVPVLATVQPGTSSAAIWVPRMRMSAALMPGSSQPPDTVRDLGRRVPDDIALVGYDNWEIFATDCRPPLTTVDVNLLQLGAEAVRHLLAALDGDTASGVIRCPGRLVVRESTGPPPV